ncbi:hypothetical protein KEM54_001905 [Ascosphaera aggregata]|nr:hypothetical protein KEM54_001905 [Ascosphaera aggregata]
MSSLFIARDQENLIHAHQKTAAAKPLNEGLKQFPPKTPAQHPKTPFRRGLNDENNLALFAAKASVKGIDGAGHGIAAGKNGGALGGGGGGGGGGGVGAAAVAGGENTVLSTAKSGKLDFITPSVPKTKERAPLGMKTTNAKARVFQTPGQASSAKPLGTVNRTIKTNRPIRRPTSSRKRRTPPVTKQQLQQKTLNVVEQQVQPDVEADDVPEPEYAPPTPIALPDPPEPIPYDRTFPQFRGRNFARNWDILYADPEKAYEQLQAEYADFDRQMNERIRGDLERVTLHEEEGDGFGEVLPAPKNQPAEAAGYQKTKHTLENGKQVGTKPEPVTRRRMVTRAMARRQRLLQEQQEHEKATPGREIIESLSSLSSSSDPDSDCYDPATNKIQLSAFKTIRSAIPNNTSSSTLLPKTRSKTNSRLTSTRSLDLRSHIAQDEADEVEARHAQAVAGSRTTVGYSKGRSVSTRLSKMKSAEGQIESNAKSTRSAFHSPLRPIQLIEMFGTPSSSDDEEYLRHEGARSADYGCLHAVHDQRPATPLSRDISSSTIEDGYDSDFDGWTDHSSDDDDDDDHDNDNDENDEINGINIAKLLKESESDAEFQLTL